MVGKIYINGLIGSNDTEKGVELVDVITQVKKQPNASSFNVYINSEGGYVNTGFDIYNYLKSLGLPITTIGTGMVASIATVIFMAGQKRVVAPGTRFMIHYPMGGVQNATAEEMDVYAKELKAVENRIIDFYSKETNLSKEAIIPLLREETFFTEKQLFDLGFATLETPMKIAARALINNQNKNKMTKKTGRFAKLLAKLTGEEIVNKVVYAADDREIKFPNLEEDAEVVVGETATIDGAPAEGEVTAADGRIFVFEAGTLVEIKEEVTNELDDEMLEEVLIEILEVVEDTAEKVETIEAEMKIVKNENKSYKEKLQKAEAIIAKMKGTSSKSAEDEKKEKNGKKQEVSGVVAQWKTNRLKKK